MIKLLTRYLLLLAIIISVNGCTTYFDSGKVSEGIVEFEVSYPELDPSSVLADLLPTKMVMKFKDDKFATDLSAGFGMFKMSIVNDGDEKEFSQLVKLINEKFIVSYDEAGGLNSLGNLPIARIEETGKTKMIAEFECKEAMVHLEGDSSLPFTIYYTDEIKLANSNWFNIFSEIDGVLLEYQIERYNLCTRFKATKVIQQEIEDEVFDISEEYESITEEEMNSKMEEIFNNFSE